MRFALSSSDFTGVLLLGGDQCLSGRGRCSLFGLTEKQLLDAAHIIPDANVQLGQPVVPNGLPLSKIHHAAFDAYMIGIDSDYRLHVSTSIVRPNSL